MIGAGEALIISAAARGEWADLSSLPQSDRSIRADFLRRLLLSHPLTKEEHLAVAKKDTAYTIYFPTDGPAFAPAFIALPGLRIRAAIIEGRLDLADCVGVGGAGLPALALESCRLLGEGKPDNETLREGEADVMTCLDLSQARIARLSLRDSRFSHVRARECQIDGPVDVSNVQPLNGWTAQPWPGVDMGRFSDRTGEPSDSSFAAPLYGKVEPTTPTDLSPWPLDPRDSCWLDCTGSRIDGEFRADAAKLRTPRPRQGEAKPGMQRFALRLAHTDIAGQVIAIQNAEFEGGISLGASNVNADVWLKGAKTRRGEGDALRVHAARIGGVFGLNADFAAFGLVRLSGTRIEADLEMDDAKLDGGGGDALKASNLSVGGNMQLGTSFVANGCLNLSGAQIDGYLSMDGASLNGNGDFAIVGDNLSVDGSVLIRERFNAVGSVRLSGAKIGRSLEICDAKLDTKNEPVLSIFATQVHGSLILRGNLFHGNLDMRSAEVASLIDSDNGYRGAGFLWLDGFSYARLDNPNMENEKTFNKTISLNFYQKIIDQLGIIDKFLSSIMKRLSMDPLIDGSGELEERPSVRIGRALKQFLIPSFKRLSIAESRRAWLERMPSFAPQPYVQLARVLAAHGYDEDARDVRVLKEERELGEQWRELLKGGLWGMPARLFLALASSLFGSLFGFGLKPARALGTLFGGFLFGWGLFWLANNNGFMVIDQQPVAGAVRSGQFGAEEQTNIATDVACADAIRPALYALDVFIPLVDLRQESKCEVGVAAGILSGLAVGPVPNGVPLLGGQEWKISAEFFRYAKALYALAGWIILSMAILTFSGVMQRREEQQ